MTYGKLFAWVAVLGTATAAINIAMYDHPSKPIRATSRALTLAAEVTVVPGSLPDPLAAMEAARDAFFEHEAEEQRIRDEEARRARELEEARQRATQTVVRGGTSANVEEFLACTRAHESDTAGGYGAVSPGGTYRGAYQFDAATWRASAIGAGYGEYAETPVDQVPAAVQDAVAAYLYSMSGNRPWNGRC